MECRKQSIPPVLPVRTALWHGVYLSLALSFYLGAEGCTHLTVAARNRAHLQQLHLGMSQQEVLTIMGTPWKTEAYIYQTIPYVVLYYLTQDPLEPTPAEEDVTLVVFENDRLVGYGDYIRTLFLFLDASRYRSTATPVRSL